MGPRYSPNSPESARFTDVFLSRMYSTLALTFISARHRPWVDLLHRSAFDFPFGPRDCVLRIKRNLSYFRLIYALLFLFILFLFLIPYPLLLLIFSPSLIAWFLYYFFCPHPLMLYHRVLDDTFILAMLWAVTAFSLLILYGAWFNVLLPFLIGFGFVATHAVLRKTDDLYITTDQDASH